MALQDNQQDALKILLEALGHYGPRENTAYTLGDDKDGNYKIVDQRTWIDPSSDELTVELVLDDLDGMPFIAFDAPTYPWMSLEQAREVATYIEHLIAEGEKLRPVE